MQHARNLIQASHITVTIHALRIQFSSLFIFDFLEFNFLKT